MIVTEEQAEKAFTYLRDTDEQHAQAKADLAAIEKHEKALLAILQKGFAGIEKSDAGQKREAYASPDYKTWLDGYKQAVFEYHLLENKRDRAFTALELYRTDQATQRAMLKV